MNDNFFEYLRKVNVAANPALPQHPTAMPLRLPSVRGVKPSLLTLREIELALQTADTIIEQAASLAEALEQIACLYATSLPVAYCRLLLMAGDGQSLIVHAAHTANAELHWEPQLGESVPLSILPDSTRLIAPLSYGSLVWPGRDSLAQEQLHHYASALGLREPLLLLLLAPLKIGERLWGVLELGELGYAQVARLDEDKAHLAMMSAKQLALPLEQRQRQAAT